MGNKNSTAIKQAKVVAIISGDTVTVVDDVNGSAHPVKLSRIQAAQIGSKNINEQTIAHAAQYALGTIVLQHTVMLRYTLRTGLTEAEIITDAGVNVNDWMLKNRYAYDPSVEDEPADWIEYHTKAVGTFSL
jgi:endonuclease YncB( thermonuclease family)